MITETLHIKHMVCRHCLAVVVEALESLGMEVLEGELGKIKVQYIEGTFNRSELRTVLETNGFALLEGKEQQIVEQVKQLIIQMVHHGNEMPLMKNSVYFEQETAIAYNRLSRLFSAQMGITIERYLILQKIERVKELITYGELSIKEIAFQMRYSSAQHLSNQFKSVTGMSMTAFRKLRFPNRISLDQVGETV